MKIIKVREFDKFEEALDVAKETAYQFTWYSSTELARAKKLAEKFHMKYLVTESLEAYKYHDNQAYNYMTKIEAGGSLTNSRPSICILKKDGTLIKTDLTVEGSDDKWLKIAKFAHKYPMSFAHIFDLHNVKMDKGDIIIWTKESMMECNYHKKQKNG